MNFSSDFMDTEQSLASTLSYGETIDTTTYSVGRFIKCYYLYVPMSVILRSGKVI